MGQRPLEISQHTIRRTILKTYKYFEKPLEYADIIYETCNFCNNKKNCMDTIYFNRHEVNEKLICFDCFEKNLLTVNVPEYIKHELIKNSQEYGYTDMKQIENKILELSQTPPIPWIQNNNWPVCCGDFTQYVGEWTQNDFNKHGDGKKILENILCDDDKKIYDIDYLWNNIGEWCCAFVFRCIKCKKLIAVCQEY